MCAPSSHGAVPARDLVDPGRRRHRGRRFGAHRDRRRDGLSRVAAVDRSRQRQPHRQRKPFGPIDVGVVVPPLRGGPFEIRSRRVPVGAVADDDLAAARAADRVVGPAAARGHPHHVRAVVGRRRHQHVIAIGDDDGVGVTGQPGPQRAFDVIDLADPVELVAGQVQQHDHSRVDRVGDVWHVHLVDLEGRQLRSAGARQRGHQTRVHVGALGVGGDRLMSPPLRLRRSQRAQRRRGHPGCRRLSVGAGHDCCAAALAELAKDGFVQRHRDQAADHRARAAARHPRRPARSGPCRQRHSSTSGDHSRHFRCPTRGITGRGLSDRRAILTL